MLQNDFFVQRWLSMLDSQFIFYAILFLFLNAVDFGATFFLVQKMAGCHLIFIAPSMHTNGPAVRI